MDDDLPPTVEVVSSGGCRFGFGRIAWVDRISELGGQSYTWLSLLRLVHLDRRTLALVSSLSKLLLKKHVYNKLLLHYRSVVKCTSP